MKKIKFTVSRCTNKVCGYYAMSTYFKKECPLCKGAMKRDNKYLVTGYDDEKTDDAFIGFKKNGNFKRPKYTKTEK